LPARKATEKSAKSGGYSEESEKKLFDFTFLFVCPWI